MSDATRASLTLSSSNSKTGPMPVSMTSAKTCPDACPLKAAGCYAITGPVAWHWRKVTNGERGTDWREFTRQISAMPSGTLWRHNQAGDLPGAGDAINEDEMAQLVRANRRKSGFTFTHKPVVGDGETATRNRAAIAAANRDGFVVNLSADDLREADELAALNIGPVVTIQDAPNGVRTDQTTPGGLPVRTCPATYKDGVTCWTCGLCARQDRKVIIGFPAHGTQRKTVIKIVRDAS